MADIELLEDDDLDMETDLTEAQELGQALISSILSRSPRSEISELLDAHAPLWFQSLEDGTSALHAAAYVDDAELVKELLIKGAIWNATDNLGNTAGDIALSLNNADAYEAIRDAGLRTELLLGLLAQKSATLDAPSTLILRAHDPTASGDTDVFLQSKLEFKTLESGQEVCTVLSNGQEVGVMMGWEREIMERTVHELCSTHPRAKEGLKILNIGFGLGIIDTLFQSLPTPPSQHVIIEAHPDVLAHMASSGWKEKPGVHIIEGKWQDAVASHPIILESGGFDIIYTDTFSEDYSELKAFFEEVPSLLNGLDARFSFFHGLGATNALFYDVYTKLSEVHLAQLGMDVEWKDVRVAQEEKDTERWGETRRYFTVPWYRMPVARMGVPGGEEE